MARQHVSHVRQVIAGHSGLLPCLHDDCCTWSLLQRAQGALWDSTQDASQETTDARNSCRIARQPSAALDEQRQGRRARLQAQMQCRLRRCQTDHGGIPIPPGGREPGQGLTGSDSTQECQHRTLSVQASHQTADIMRAKVGQHLLGPTPLCLNRTCCCCWQPAQPSATCWLATRYIRAWFDQRCLTGGLCPRALQLWSQRSHT